MIKENIELHTHTDASLFDGAQSYKDLIDRAIELDFKAIAITNHGNCADLVDAWTYLKKKKDAGETELKLIFGVEGYVAKCKLITFYCSTTCIASDYLDFKRL